MIPTQWWIHHESNDTGASGLSLPRACTSFCICLLEEVQILAEDQLYPVLTVCGCDDHTVCPGPRSCPQDEASFHLHSPRSPLSALSWRWRQSLAREDRTEFQHRCLVLGKRSRPIPRGPFFFSVLLCPSSLRGSNCYCSLLGLPHCPLRHNSPRPAPPS